ncbi:MAG: alpha-glucan family phosphorylase [Bdellovibrio sp.]|nr:alpha-glucan family phosphorylase [Bdellovibrio sp.]
MEKPDFIFEVSWEICNMVGGIHTVIQSKAAQIRERFGEDYICVGPHVLHPISATPSFREEIWSDAVYKLIQDFTYQGVSCRMGRWNIPGGPKVLLVGFKELFAQKDRILAHYWEHYGVESLFGGFDYTEPVLFSHASGLLIEQISNRLLLSEGKRVLVHAHEWMTSIALLHLKETCPDIATVFTTHATILGRSLSSRDHQKTLDSYLASKPATVWAQETGVESKHSVEVISAREADCFTTVSETTSDECGLILGKKADVVVNNGLSDDIPSPELLDPSLRKKMRLRMLQIAREVTGFNYDSDQTFMMVTAGRYEFRNKGIDLFIDASLDLKDSLANGDSKKKVIAFVMCPAGHGHRVFPHAENAFSTHTITDPSHDPLLDLLNHRGQVNSANNPVHVIFLPLYLNGTDSTLTETYWELASGMDLAVFASWYEPWGYTPHESVALGLPTCTTDCAGFGRWVQSLPGSDKEKGVVVIKRTRGDVPHNYEEIRAELKKKILEILNASPVERKQWSEAALQTAKRARWSDLIEGYLRAYSFAIERATLRVSKSPHARFRSFSLGNVVAPSRFSHARANVKKFSVTTRFPNVQKSLRQFMGRTMSWKWDPYVLQLFYQLDRKLWEEVDQIPLKFIRNADDETVKKISANSELRKLFNGIRVGFEADDVASANAFAAYDRAYFCMEYGITDKLRIYSGGLGMLAGDHLKTASDMKIPIVAFGLFYQYGYFRQVLTQDGQQLANYDRSELENLEINLVQDVSGGRLLLSIPFNEEELYFQIWRLDLHGVDLLLLDSNVMENPVRLRVLTDRLYSAEPGKRIGQEWLLSMGGLELIKKLGLNISVFHMNEGHTAFLVVGRILELMEQHQLNFDEAFDYVRFTTIFTTHTPVAAGHDEFARDEAIALLKRRIQNQPILDRIMGLGASLKGLGIDDKFSMTGMALRGSRWVNAVSKIHESVSQRMFNNLFPDLDEDEVPVTHVTNGVHIPSWLEPTWQDLFFEVLGDQWPKRLNDVDYWLKLQNLPLERVAEKKLILKRRLISWIKKRLAGQLDRGAVRPEYAEILARLDENTLIITHAKRMAPYKRADILFEDADRLAEIIRRSPVPILFIYAGKAHPSDGMGQEVLQRIARWSKDPRFSGSVLVLEDYDLSYSRRLLSGSDIWLNTPLRPLEASGTSGMKGAINGTLHFSVADGWWPESYNGNNGWMIGDGSELWDKSLQDDYDRARIFSLLENEILKDFVKPEGQSFSPAWISRVRESIYTILPFVASERMLEDYQHRLYQPALNASHDLKKNNFAELRNLTNFKKTLTEHWHLVAFENVDSEGLETDNIPRSKPAQVIVELSHPNLTVEHIRVQAVLTHQASSLHEVQRQIIACECISSNASSRTKWRLRLDNRRPGDFTLAFRAIARHYSGFEDAGFELKLVKWM